MIIISQRHVLKHIIGIFYKQQTPKTTLKQQITFLIII